MKVLHRYYLGRILVVIRQYLGSIQGVCRGHAGSFQKGIMQNLDNSHKVLSKYSVNILVALGY